MNQRRAIFYSGVFLLLGIGVIMMEFNDYEHPIENLNADKLDNTSSIANTSVSNGKYKITEIKPAVQYKPKYDKESSHEKNTETEMIKDSLIEMYDIYKYRYGESSMDLLSQKIITFLEDNPSYTAEDLMMMALKYEAQVLLVGEYEARQNFDPSLSH